MDELDLAIEEKDEKIKKFDSAAQKKVDKVNSDISDLKDKMEKEKKKKDAAVAKEENALGYKYMKAVKQSRTPKVDPDDDPDLNDGVDGKAEGVDGMKAEAGAEKKEL